MEFDLLRAVADRPDDDAPRLAYADWLDENGRTERAELIRLQLRANAAGAAVEPQVAARQDELLAAHGAEWLGELADQLTSAVYERGFLMACKAGPIESEALRRSLLWATVQRLETADPRLAASPAMWSLREVRGLSPQGLARLCESATPSRVESIACAPPKSESDEEEDEDEWSQHQPGSCGPRRPRRCAGNSARQSSSKGDRAGAAPHRSAQPRS
jgi:uncharacterized protein (TIGR02996 family)